ncbi:MAG: type III-B CRISPR module RAMP protein Cmr4 [Eubacteriaceae bacterium]
MKVDLYKITCLTNMHVGNGDVNFNIIDNEVQRDPVTNLPTINSSGIKGALREYFSELNKEAMKKDEEDIINIFGTNQNESESRPGKLKFLSGNLLALPMRASKGDKAFYMVTTKNAIHQYLELIQLSNAEDLVGLVGIENEINPSKSYKIDDSEIAVEGKIIEEKICNEDLKSFLKKHIGDNAVIMKEADMKEISLPVMSRNYLINGESKNLWYEEIVPHHSIFYFTVITNNLDSEYEELFNGAVNKKIIQFGGNASIGYGFTKVEKL